MSTTGTVLGGAPGNLPILSGAICGMGLMQLVNTLRVLSAAQYKSHPIIKAAFTCIFFGMAYFCLAISATAFGGFDAPWEKAAEAVLYITAAVCGDYTFLLRAVPCSKYPILTKMVFWITALTKVGLYWVISLSSLWPNPPFKGSDRTMIVSTGYCVIQVLSNVYLTTVFVSYLIRRTRVTSTPTNATLQDNNVRYRLVYRTAVEFCAFGLTIVSIGRIIRAADPKSEFSQICLDISKTVELCNAPFLVTQMRRLLDTGSSRDGSSGGVTSGVLSSSGLAGSTMHAGTMHPGTTLGGATKFRAMNEGYSGMHDAFGNDGFGNDTIGMKSMGGGRRVERDVEFR
ncbi:hypothetical protein HK104_002362 [Borealophlyctis nickersoniae]|nr:hypothetical protein HK104_002362 [Borealophlyctis nickersoniae]